MTAVFVKGNWMNNVVHPNIILRFIHREELGIVQDFLEDNDYNVTLYIKNTCVTCVPKLMEEFSHYEFTVIQ